MKKMPPRQKGEKGGNDMLSLLLPLGAGIITRLALRPRGQGPCLDIPWWGLLGKWMLILPGTLWLLAEPTGGNVNAAFALIVGAGAAGLLIPEIFRGLGQAVVTGLGKPKNWLWLGIIAVVLYGLLVNPEILGWLLTLGVMWVGYRIILGMFKPPKKGGG